MPRVTDLRFVEDALRLFIVPEINRRQEAGKAETPFPLRRAQVVFSPEGRRSVRLNDEIELMMRVKADSVDRSRIGTVLYWDEVEDVASAHLPGDADTNSAHLTIIWDAGRAAAVFADFTYNRERAFRLCEAAQEFLDSASWSLTHDNLRVFVDNLFSAAELTAKGFFFTFADPGVTRKTNHKAIHTRVNKHSWLGNLGEDFGKVFNILAHRRAGARYSDENPEPYPDPEWLRETVERTLAALRTRVAKPCPTVTRAS